MSKVLGDIDCQGAVFVYKDDSSVPKAWAAVQKVAGKQPIRGELHSDKAEFLESLSAWVGGVDPTNAFLCIYSHAGPLGVNCASGDAARRVTWLELANALSPGVSLLWLLGCESVRSLKVWTAKTQPVRDLLLTTTESARFDADIVEFFNEINLNNIVPFAEMPEFLSRVAPDLARKCRYFTVGAGGKLVPLRGCLPGCFRWRRR